jgi:murein DD-endopeptidase MepM/ murein hydrolase activator NlpD
MRTILALLCAAATGVSAPGGLDVAVAARSIQPGELVVLTVKTPPGVERLRVRAFDRDAPAFEDRAGSWRALIGIDLDVTPGAHVVTLDARAGTRALHASHELVVTPRKFATRTLTVDEAYVNPPPEVQERIAQDNADLLRVWQSSAPKRLWTEAFVRPVPGQSVSRFGTRSIFNGQARNPHNGGDFLSPAGTPIEAPNAGRVALARDLYFSGNTVVIDHGLGMFSTLAHMSQIDVAEGEVVKAGQVVGRVGATGRVTGPHLHWAVRVGGARVDPLSVLAVLGPQP